MKTLRIAAAVAILVAVAFGQGSVTISGIVTASATGNSALQGVTVTATETKTGVVTTTRTNEAGNYIFSGLAPGTYRLDTDKSGYSKVSFTDIVAKSGERYRFNMTLRTQPETK